MLSKQLLTPELKTYAMQLTEQFFIEMCLTHRQPLDIWQLLQAETHLETEILPAQKQITQPVLNSLL